MKNRNKEIRNDIIDILKGDEARYFAIMRKGSCPNIVENRRNVWALLHTKGYPYNYIARYFGTSASNVMQGLKKINQYKKQAPLPPLTHELINQTLATVGNSQGLMVEELILKGYTIQSISNFLKITYHKLYWAKGKAVNQRDFENKRKNIVKL